MRVGFPGGAKRPSFNQHDCHGSQRLVEGGDTRGAGEGVSHIVARRSSSATGRDRLGGGAPDIQQRDRPPPRFVQPPGDARADRNDREAVLESETCGLVVSPSLSAAFGDKEGGSGVTASLLALPPCVLRHEERPCRLQREARSDQRSSRISVRLHCSRSVADRAS